MENERVEWICDSCATKAGGILKNHIATWHMEECEICGKYIAVTEPREYRYPNLNKIQVGYTVKISSLNSVPITVWGRQGKIINKSNGNVTLLFPDNSEFICKENYVEKI